MKNLKQGTYLLATADFSLKTPGKGRGLMIKVGQRFMVTSASYSNSASALIDRASKSFLGMGHRVSVDNLAEFFKIEV